MHIAFCLDNNYVPFCAGAIASVIENNKGEKITFHLLVDDITTANVHKYRTWISTFEDVALNIYSINKEDFKDFPIGGAYINISTYFRLLMPVRLSHLEKVIYLDCDIVINGSLKELWNTDLSDYALTGVRDRINDYIRVYNRLGYPMKDGYVNAGVLLINLKYWRETHVFERAIDVAKQMPTHLKNHDQDIINLLYHGKILMLDFKYNVLEYYFYTEEWIYMDCKYYPQIVEACQHPVIVHFCMPQKPWHIECINPYKELYRQYLRETPWREIPLKHKVQKRSRKEMLKLWLEKMGVYKVERKTTLRKCMGKVEDEQNILF